MALIRKMPSCLLSLSRWTTRSSALLFFTVVLCRASGASALETSLYKAPLPSLPDSVWDRLRTGEVVVLEEDYSIEDNDRSYADVVQLVLIEAPSREVFTIVDDCARFIEFMPNTDKVTLLDGWGESTEVNARLWRFDLSVAFLTVTYFPITVSDPDNLVVNLDLHQELKSDLKMSVGHWWLYPLDNDTRTLIVYALRAENRWPLPRFVEQYAAETGLRGILANTRNRVLSGGTWKTGDPPPP